MIESLGLLVLLEYDKKIEECHASILNRVLDIFKFRGYVSQDALNSTSTILAKYTHSYSKEQLSTAYAKYASNSKLKNTKKQLIIENNSIIVDAPNTPALKRLCTSNIGSSWNRTTRKYQFPIGLPEVIIDRFREDGFEINFELLSNRRKKSIDEIPGLNATLYPYQKEGIEFINYMRGNCLVADEMGLGKTIQALAYIQYQKRRTSPTLIVMPASLKLNWRREIDKFMTGFTYQVIMGGSSVLEDVDITLMNYDVLHKYTKKIIKHRYKLLVADEVHYVKSKGTKRTKAFLSVRSCVDKLIALTGTPIANRPIEIFTILHALSPDLFSSESKFALRYCGAKKTNFGWDYSGSTNKSELYSILTSSFMIRRLKSKVLTQLPDKTRVFVPMEIDLAAYKKYHADTLAELKREDAKAIQLVIIEKLKQKVVELKIDACLSWMEDFIESGEKLVVFTTHVKVLDMIYKKFKKIAVRYDGSCSDAAKDTAVDKFQNDDSIRLFAGNLIAAGTGLTLTAAASTCHIELSFIPALHLQGEDRVHRIGQKADAVYAYYLLAEKTIDEKIFKSICAKTEVISAVIDDKHEDIDFVDDILCEMGV